jgi:hypothetical protein
LLIVLLLAGCGNTDSTIAGDATPYPAHASAVHVVRTSDAGAPGLPAFDYTSHDSAKVQVLYEALLQLPVYGSRGIACPTDTGVQYQLTFSHGKALVLSAIADPSGCQVVVIAGQDNRTAAHTNLWSLIAAAVGVQPSAVYPVPAS